MAIRTDDRLHQLLGRHEEDLRTERWVWFHLIDSGISLAPEGINHRDANNVLANILEQIPNALDGVLQWDVSNIVPEHKTTFIDRNNARQIRHFTRMLNEYLAGLRQQGARVPAFDFPVTLSDSEQFFILLDCWPENARTKLEQLIVFEGQWKAKQDKEKVLFAWFRGKDEAARCECAWEWLKEKNPYLATHYAPFKEYAALVDYFDQHSSHDAEKQLQVLAIKRRMSQRKYRTKLDESGKRQCNFVLSDTTIKALDTLAQTAGLERPDVLEILIQREAEMGLYIREKLKQIKQLRS